MSNNQTTPSTPTTALQKMMKLYLKRYYLLPIFSSIFLSGCVSLSLPKSSQATFQKRRFSIRRQQLLTLQNWTIKGAFSFQQGKQAAIASYTWQQNQHHYRLQVHSSLNIYSVTIEGIPGRVTLRQANNKSFTANSPERLMQERLGWSLPISALKDWIRGLPTDKPYQAHFDTFGHITTLQQGKWHIVFSHYITINNIDLPQRLLITGPTLKMKIVIKKWQENKPSTSHPA